MQDQDRPLACGCSASPDEVAERIGELEGVVLRALLDPPNAEIGHHLDDFARELHQERVLVEAVVGRLIAGGLATRKDDWIKPSAVALYFQRINAGWG